LNTPHFCASLNITKFHHENFTNVFWGISTNY
jgi:hypothetical protein